MYAYGTYPLPAQDGAQHAHVNDSPVSTVSSTSQVPPVLALDSESSISVPFATELSPTVKATAEVSAHTKKSVASAAAAAAVSATQDLAAQQEEAVVRGRTQRRRSESMEIVLEGEAVGGVDDDGDSIMAMDGGSSNEGDDAATVNDEEPSPVAATGKRPAEDEPEEQVPTKRARRSRNRSSGSSSGGSTRSGKSRAARTAAAAVVQFPDVEVTKAHSRRRMRKVDKSYNWLGWTLCIDDEPSQLCSVVGSGHGFYLVLAYNATDGKSIRRLRANRLTVHDEQPVDPNGLLDLITPIVNDCLAQEGSSPRRRNKPRKDKPSPLSTAGRPSSKRASGSSLAVPSNDTMSAPKKRGRRKGTKNKKKGKATKASARLQDPGRPRRGRGRPRLNARAPTAVFPVGEESFTLQDGLYIYDADATLFNAARLLHFMRAGDLTTVTLAPTFVPVPVPVPVPHMHMFHSTDEDTS